MHETSILLTAFRLRKMIDDFIDCIVLSSAINHAEVGLQYSKELAESSLLTRFQMLPHGSELRFGGSFGA